MGLLFGLKDKIILNFGKAMSCFLIRKRIQRNVLWSFDTETTGLDFRTDVIMLIGAVGIVRNTISVKDSLELFMIQTVLKEKRYYSWYSKVR
jgi:DNA polymerase-3 subunit epsilon